jgi:hypothetical protein
VQLGQFVLYVFGAATVHPQLAQVILGAPEDRELAQPRGLPAHVIGAGDGLLRPDQRPLGTGEPEDIGRRAVRSPALLVQHPIEIARGNRPSRLVQRRRRGPQYWCFGRAKSVLSTPNAA